VDKHAVHLMLWTAVYWVYIHQEWDVLRELKLNWVVNVWFNVIHLRVTSQDMVTTFVLQVVEFRY
jgi:hypothetical protein